MVERVRTTQQRGRQPTSKRRARLRFGATVLSASVLLGACTGGQRSAAPPTSKAAPVTTATPTSTTRVARLAKSYDPFLRQTIASIRTFWRKEMPAVYGEPYDDIGGGIYAYSSGSVIPPCEGFSMPYLVIQQNAFYCPREDFIAWDDEGLFPRLEKRYGPLLLATVLAHEWGHAIQERNGDLFGLDTISTEQQADCFAGAWTASIDPATQPQLAKLRSTSLDRVLSGFVEFRDQLGMTADTFGAHGTAFDRIRAFQDGYVNGATTCEGYIEELPELVAIPFRSFKERFRGGNMPLDELAPTLTAKLSSYFGLRGGPTTQAADADVAICMGTPVRAVGLRADDLTPDVFWCADDGLVHYDPTAITKAYDTIGDFGAGILLALGYAGGQAAARGVDTTTKAGALSVICSAGEWAATLYDTDNPKLSELSPGDPDEAVRMLLERLDGDPVISSGFDRVAAFRKGMLGEGPC